MRNTFTLFVIALLSYGSPDLVGSKDAIMMIEVCNNGIDDDMDGLIDINDDDCQCDPVVPSGLIPNPSFEEQSCCPEMKGQLNCADSWIQASAATTDYVNTCGFLGNVIDMPLPVADGTGAIGLRDGSSNDGNYKEYAGACLSEPIEAGKSYRLKINVGFRTATTSPGFRLSIFGHPTCNNLPFGNGNASIGCPSNTPGWVLLGEVPVSGLEEWIETEINFSSTQNIQAVAIGPDCSRRASGVDRYYFFDNLRLAETIDFGYQVTVNSGNPCQSNYNLSLSDTAPGETYQWYRNGIAIPNATQSNYDVPDNSDREGLYQVRIEDPSGCQLTEGFNVVIDQGSFNASHIACANSTYTFGSQELTSSGVYSESFIDSNGCDSLVTLQLTVRAPILNEIDTTICRGQSFQLGADRISLQGNYSATLSDQFGCDSIVILNLSVKEPSTSIELIDMVVELGDNFILDLQGQEVSLQSFIWSSDMNDICTDCVSQDIAPLVNSSYYLDAVDINNCPLLDTLNIIVNKSYKVFVPNVFSPNADGRNDVFTIFPGNAVANVKSFYIFDRWGTLIYEALNTLSVEWDGSHKGQPLNMDTFIYAAEVEFIDGYSKIINGSIQIIR